MDEKLKKRLIQAALAASAAGVVAAGACAVNELMAPKVYGPPPWEDEYPNEVYGPPEWFDGQGEESAVEVVYGPPEWFEDEEPVDEAALDDEQSND